MHNYGCIVEVGDCIIITKAPTETVGAQRVEKVFFNTLQTLRNTRRQGNAPTGVQRYVEGRLT